jgi:hypothetical protein
MRSITEWALIQHNKNIGIVTPTNEILKHAHLEILKKLTASVTSFGNSTRYKFTLSNGTKIFLNIYRDEGIAPFIGLSLDVLLFHNYVADEQRRAISRIMSPALGRGCMIGTLIT